MKRYEIVANDTPKTDGGISLIPTVLFRTGSKPKACEFARHYRLKGRDVSVWDAKLKTFAK